MNKQHINEVFENWGRAHFQIPANNTSFKSDTLSKLTVSATVNKKHSIPWASASFALVALAVFVSSSIDWGQAGTMENLKVGRSSSEQADVRMPDVYYAGNSAPVSDDRQFLKTYYNAVIKTRDVSSSVAKVELAVRGFGGRIDSSNTSEEYGHVTFAIPVDKLGSFKEEIGSLMLDKLVVERVSSENLLPQKLSIEEETSQAGKALAELRTSRARLVNSHSQIVGSYIRRINEINAQITTLQSESQISELQAERGTIAGLLSAENSEYNKKLSALDNNIKAQETSLEYLKAQDKRLIENVATVNGTISFDKTILWEIADIYTPGPLLGWILVIMALAAYRKHKSSLYFPA